MPGWIKGLILSLDLNHALLLQELHGCSVSQPHTPAQLFDVVGGSGKRPLQIVHYYKKASQEPVSLCLGLILCQPLLAPAKVVHLSLQSQCPVAPFVQLTC